MSMLEKIKNTCDRLSASFDSIDPMRKEILEKIANYIQNRVDENKYINLIYVCTHNSRRSHFGQIWSAVAAEYYKIPNVHTFSGGVELTAFNPSAIRALESLGFRIEKLNDKANPLYHVYYQEKKPVECFSKEVQDIANPQSDFAAIMTCSEAEQNCPFIPNASLRLSTTYEDPKLYDGTTQEHEQYVERSLLIGLESLYVYSLINK